LDQSKYRGDYVDNYRHGNGRYYWPNGEVSTLSYDIGPLSVLSLCPVCLMGSVKLAIFSVRMATGTITNFYNFKILTASSKGSICVTIPNFVAIVQTIAEIRRFCDFSKWRLLQTWILKISTGGRLQRVLCNRTVVCPVLSVWNTGCSRKSAQN